MAVVFPQSRDEDNRVSYTHLTFQQLHEDSNRLASGFESIGIRRGTRTVLMVQPSLDFFATTFALFKVGAVLVLIDPGMGIRNLGRCLAQAKPEAFIGVPKAHLARKLFGWSRTTIRTTVCTRKQRWLAEHNLDCLRRKSSGDYKCALTHPNDLAAILFTSGSTGPAKGAIYTHHIFEKQVEILQKMYGISHGEVDLATFPLFALFGPALGMTAIIPDMNPTRPANVDPKKIVEAIENFGVTNLFGSPALLNRLARYDQLQSESLRSLKRVTSAGAPVPIKVIERLQSKLPEKAYIHTPYGATESLPVATVCSRTLLKETRQYSERGCGTCIGQPVSDMDVKIIAISDAAISNWQDGLSLPVSRIGEIVVHGPVVTQAYYAHEEANKLSKILDPQTGRNRHRMGDLGYLDSEGRLWFCGRKSHRVETERGTLFSIPTEAIFNSHPMVFRSALVGVTFDGKKYPILCIELEKDYTTHGPDIVGELFHLAKQQPHTRAIQAILIHPKFPVDIRHNAKIFREKLALWATQRLQRRKFHPQPLTEDVALPPTFDELRSRETPA